MFEGKPSKKYSGNSYKPDCHPSGSNDWFKVSFDCDIDA
jgi:hypothetical protein